MENDIDYFISQITSNTYFIRLKNIIENFEGWHDRESVFDHSLKTARIAKQVREGDFIVNQQAKQIFLQWMNEEAGDMKKKDIVALTALLHDCGKILSYKEGEEIKTLLTNYPTESNWTMCPGHEYFGGELVVGTILKSLNLNNEVIESIKNVVKSHDVFASSYFASKQNWALQDIISDAKSRAGGYYKEAMFNVYCDGYTASAFVEGKKKIEEIFNESSFYTPRTYFIPD